MVGPPHLPLAILVISLSASCVTSGATPCGDRVCPVGRACAHGASGDTCVDTTVVTACEHLSEGATCSVAEVGTGTCQTGLCLIGSCGDGIVNIVEDCDGDNLAGKTCIDYGSTNASGLKCTPDCSYDISGCTGVCGDGIKGSAEDCDASDFGGKTCVDYGFYTGSLACTDQCKINLGQCSGQCGNAMIDGFEPCDGSDLGGDSCMLQGYKGPVVPLSCTATCTFSADSCTCGGVLCAPTTQTCVFDGVMYSCHTP